MTLYAAFGDVHGAARTHLSVAIGSLWCLLLLLDFPAIRPTAPQAVPRTAHVAFMGRLLISLLWLARALVGGLMAYQVSGQLQEQPGFHTLSAALSAAGQLLSLALECGRAMAGFHPEWGFTRRPLSVLRFLLNATFGVLLAGYASVLPGVVETVLTWVPSHTYALSTHVLPGWLDWTAGPVTMVLCMVWFGLVVPRRLERLRPRPRRQTTACAAGARETADGRGAKRTA
ncbi:hypothetical protein [Streptomyces coffeae]|uniref:DUF4386 domain-containing protein n=1 Tax=Streptomyces coffeae TaxID=621382 RepID=A0ABS1NLW5_9ACTN|nr:hypothetical protein [Streptomyces coffeae]MBL1101073.1 hypothetical protein [Streptomyces coffeae]